MHPKLATLRHINDSAQAHSDASSTTSYFACSVLVDAFKKQRLHHLALPMASTTATYFACSLLGNTCGTQPRHHLHVPIRGRKYKSRETILQEYETIIAYASQDDNTESH